jgi:hypothetical protein
MNSKSEKLARSLRRLKVEALLLGCLIAGALYVFDAPAWTCYFAGVPALPFLLIRMIQIDPPGEERALTRRESLTGWLRLCGNRLRRPFGSR